MNKWGQRTKWRRDTLLAEAQNAMAADLDEATFEEYGNVVWMKKVVNMLKGSAERTRCYLPW